jgi:hypothetical protein
MPTHREKLAETIPLHQETSMDSSPDTVFVMEEIRSRSRITQRILVNTTTKLYAQNPSVISNIASSMVAAIFGAAVALTEAP